MTEQVAPRRSLPEMLEELNRLGDELADATFDPEQAVGDIRGKVDNIHGMLAAFKTFQEHFANLAEPIAKKASVLANNWKRLRDHTSKAMRRNGMEKLPGDVQQVVLRKATEPKLPISRLATVHDFLTFPDHVKQITLYSWDEAKIKADALEGKLVLRDNSRCDHTENFERPIDPRMWEQLGGRCLDCGVRVKPSELVDVKYSDIPARLEWSWWPEFKVNVPESLEPKKRKRKNEMEAG